MNQQVYEAVLSNVSKGLTQTRACHDALTTIAHLISWLATHPNGQVLQATLLQAEGDAHAARADYLHGMLSKRIDDGLVRTPQIAAVEQAEITRLRKEGQALRVRAEKMTAASKLAASNSSWLDRRPPKSRSAD